MSNWIKNLSKLVFGAKENNQLMVYVDSLINERNKLVEENSGSLMTSATDPIKIAANAKQEQILDNLHVLYNCIKNTKPTVAEKIRNSFKGTYYFNLFA